MPNQIPSTAPIAAATANIAPSTVMTAEVQDVCAKRVTQRRTRKSIAAGQSPDQYQVRRCQPAIPAPILQAARSEEHTSELQSRGHLVCRLLLEKKNTTLYHAYPLKKQKSTTKTTK